MDDCAPIAAYTPRRKRVPPRWGVVKLRAMKDGEQRTYRVRDCAVTDVAGSGVPVVVDGQIIGAVGVSGLTEHRMRRSRKRQQRCWRNK